MCDILDILFLRVCVCVGGGVTKLIDMEYFGRGILQNAECLILCHFHVQQFKGYYLGLSISLYCSELSTDYTDR